MTSQTDGDAAVGRTADLVVHAIAVLTALAAAVSLAPAPALHEARLGAAQDRAALVADIAELPLAAPQAVRPYAREEFPHWTEVGAGCDTRCAVLDRQRSPHGWVSAYDGYVATSAAELEIDHVVPLAEAWVSGASTWTLAQRRAFANDLDGAGLLAVSSWSNRDKGADDPAVWRPPDRRWWCAYAGAWVAVKLRWGLSADATEVGALVEMARTC